MSDGDRFQRALRFAFHVEGGHVNHPLDRGGATNYGITQSTYAVWRAQAGLPQQPVKFVTLDEAESIYREFYWSRGACDRLPAPIDLVHFDACVNHGVAGAARLLQAVAGVSQDGVIGPATMGAIRKADPELLARRYVERRRKFYGEIVAAIPSQSIFLRGWLNRMDALSKEIQIA